MLDGPPQWPGQTQRQAREAMPRPTCQTVASRTINNWYLNYFISITPPPWLAPQLCGGSQQLFRWFSRVKLLPAMTGASEQLTAQEASTKSSL